MNDILFSIFPSENYIDLNLYQFGWEKCDPGHSFGPISRNHYLFHYVISGKGILMADNEKGESITYHVKKGQGFLIFPGQINTYIADKEHPWEYCWLEFDGLRIKESLYVTDLTRNSTIYKSHSPELQQKMLEEMLYIVNNSDQSSFNLIGHMYLFFDYFLNSCKHNNPIKNERISDYYIKEAINFIEQNYQNSITVEDIAAMCCISRSYFSKIFHNLVGKSPQEFLIKYRMIKAIELLKITNLSVGDISVSVGYENPLHFSRTFKNIYGISPKKWRLKNK